MVFDKAVKQVGGIKGCGKLLNFLSISNCHGRGS